MRHFATLLVPTALCLCLLGSQAYAQVTPEQISIIAPASLTTSRGQVVTVRVVTRNTSTTDLLPGSAAGGVTLGLSIPEGFAYRVDSGRVDLADGTTVPRDFVGLQAPLPLPAGKALGFRYQLVTTSVRAANRIASHGVWLDGEAGGMVSGRQEIALRVASDPEFDEAFALGRVYCDANGNGRFDGGEVGVGGVRIVADTGRVVDTDHQGFWHVRRLTAGQHLIKLDAATLPPGSQLTTSDKAMVYITPGIPQKANFGVSCAGVMVKPDSVIGPQDGSAAHDGAEQPLEVMTITGSADGSGLRVDGAQVPELSAGLSVEGSSRGGDGKFETVASVNLPWRPGALRLPLVFHTTYSLGGPPSPSMSWHLRVVAVGPGAPRGGRIVRELFGSGGPPETIKWNGTDGDASQPVIERGGLYQVALTVSDGVSGTASSAPVMVGISHGSAAGEIKRWTLRGRLFNDDMGLRKKLKRSLVKLNKRRMGEKGARFLVEVHTDASGIDANDLMRTRRAAFNIRDHMATELHVPGDRLMVVGVGSARPVRPNIGERNRALNRRVEVALLAPEDASALEAPARPEAEGLIEVQGDDLGAIDASGFAHTVKRPVGGLLTVVVRRADGSVRDVVLGRPAGPAPAEATPALAPESAGDAKVGGPKAQGETHKALPVGVTDLPEPSITITAPASTGAEAVGPAGQITNETAGQTTSETAGQTTSETAGQSTDAAAGGAGGQAAGEHGVGAKPNNPAGVDEAPGSGASHAGASGLHNDPLGRFGGKPLAEALGGASTSGGAGYIADEAITAGQFEVQLPPRGLALNTTRLYIPGKTHPANQITINGAPVKVRDDGTFAELVPIPSGKSSLVIESTDASGHRARIEWPVEVRNTEFFLLAFADGVGGQVGARLEELDTYHVTKNDTLFMAGRGALYAKARISGSALAKDLFITAAVDTAKRRDFAAFYDQVVDPARDYIVFGDSADDIQDANARGPFYLLVEADKSKLLIGSFKTELEGIHLFRYNRTFYGAKLDVDKTLAEGYRTQLKAFVTEDNRRLVRGHDELRATGGSLYYLSRRDVVEGSERLFLTVREMDTGLELGRTPLVRDTHYRVDYRTGRVSFNGPVSSTMSAMFAVDGYQPFTGRSMLDGHQIWVVADYESRSAEVGGDVAAGVHARQEIAGIVEIGGGYVREDRPGFGDVAATPYELWSVEAKVKLGKSSFISAEYAKAKGQDGVSLVSTDGGFEYKTLRRSAGEDEGQALKFSLDTNIGELAGIEEDLDLRVTGWYQLIEAGYHASGLVNQQGTERWGGLATWKPSKRDRLDLRYDGGTTLVADLGFNGGYRAVKRNRFNARYERNLGVVDLIGEGSFGQHRDDGDGLAYNTGAAMVGARLKVTPDFSVLLTQEAIMGGDDKMVGPDWQDRLTTNVMLDYRIAKDMALTAGQSFRWNGDNSTRVGLRTVLEDGTSVYVEDRFKPGEQNGRVVHSLVTGAERTSDDGTGRVYGEYRLDSGVGGMTNRAVMGVGKAFELAEGVKVTGAYERNQALGGVETGRIHDTLSAGIEILTSDNWKFGGRYEVRLDRGGADAPNRELLQAVVRNALDAKLGEDMSMMLMFNYSMAQDLKSRAFLKEELESTVGFTIRPRSVDWLTLIARYSRLIYRDQSQVLSSSGGLGGLLKGVEQRDVSDLVSLNSIFEFWRLTYTLKLAYRHTATRLSDVPLAETDLYLWGNRLSFDIWAGLGLAGEFRVTGSLNQLDVAENGGLVELSYNLMGHARVGIGWNINGVAASLIPGRATNDTQDGFYVRVTGAY